MHSDDQILQIEMLHPLDQPQMFYTRLRTSISQATAMRGAVAFWTIHPHFVSATLPKLLDKPDSFLCLDIHPPTSIDLLCELAKEVSWISGRCASHDPSIYVHLRDLEGQTEIRGANSEMPDELLHTKTLLFDLGDGVAEIWVGSHNWTRRAMVGVNIESSLVARVSTSSALYQQISRMLDQIRQLCQPFDPRLARYYKWLQGKIRPKAFFELEGEQANTLAHKAIKLFGTEKAEAASLKTIGNKICLAVRDTVTGYEYLYDATVSTSSEDEEDIARLADSLQTNKQRFVFREGRRFLRLEQPIQPADPNPIRNAAYGATINIHTQLPSTAQIFALDHDDLWVETQDDPVFSKLRAIVDGALVEAGKEYEQSVRDILERVTLRVAPPVNQEMVQQIRSTQQEDHASDDLPLFTKRIIEHRPKQDI